MATGTQTQTRVADSRAGSRVGGGGRVWIGKKRRNGRTRSPEKSRRVGTGATTQGCPSRGCRQPHDAANGRGAGSCWVHPRARLAPAHPCRAPERAADGSLGCQRVAPQYMDIKSRRARSEIVCLPLITRVSISVEFKQKHTRLTLNSPSLHALNSLFLKTTSCSGPSSRHLPLHPIRPSPPRPAS